MKVSFVSGRNRSHVSSISADDHPDPTSMIRRGLKCRIVQNSATASKWLKLPLAYLNRRPGTCSSANGSSGW